MHMHRHCIHEAPYYSNPGRFEMAWRMEFDKYIHIVKYWMVSFSYSLSLSWCCCCAVRRPLLVLAELREKGKKKKKKKKKIYDLHAPQTTTSRPPYFQTPTGGAWRTTVKRVCRLQCRISYLSGASRQVSQVDGEHSRLSDYLKRQKLTKWKRESLRGTASAERRRRERRVHPTTRNDEMTSEWSGRVSLVPFRVLRSRE